MIDTIKSKSLQMFFCTANFLSIVHLNMELSFISQMISKICNLFQYFFFRMLLKSGETFCSKSRGTKKVTE